MTRKQKWIEYRRILRALYRTCWDCERPCCQCQAWARAKAFGREPTCDFAEACAEAYEASMEMQRRGTSILIGM
jgi:hypothetical protein